MITNNAEIQKQKRRRSYPRRNFKGLRRIAIEEFAVKKNTKTVVVDPHSGEIVYVGDGKGKDALELFWIGISCVCQPDRRLKQQNKNYEKTGLSL